MKFESTIIPKRYLNKLQRIENPTFMDVLGMALTEAGCEPLYNKERYEIR